MSLLSTISGIFGISGKGRVRTRSETIQLTRNDILISQAKWNGLVNGVFEVHQGDQKFTGTLRDPKPSLTTPNLNFHVTNPRDGRHPINRPINLNKGTVTLIKTILD